MKKCVDCGTTKNLTKHSLTGSHKPPFINLCELCHNRRHKVKRTRFSKTQRGNLKNTLGTSRRKNK